MLKIGLTGAGGTGKGTLAASLSKATHDGMQVIPSSIQHVGGLILPQVKSYADIQDTAVVPFSGRMAYQYSIVIAQIENERLLAAQGRSYISERSVFDFLAYVQDCEDKAFLSDYTDMIHRAYESNPYDIVFYLPADDFVPQDGRTTASWKERNEASRIETDICIRSILMEHHAKGVYELRGSVEERVACAVNILEKCKKEG